MIVLLALALGLRLLWIAIHPVPLVTDYAVYHEHAVALVERAVYSDDPDYPPLGFWPPGWSLALAAFYSLGGGHPQLGVAMGVILEWGAIVLAALAACRLLRPAFATGAVAGMAFYPGAFAYSPVLGSEHLAALVFTGAVVLAAFARPTMSTSLVAGLLGGALLLVRPDYGLPLALVLAVWLVRARREGKIFALGAVMLAGGLICVGPWTVRNAVTFGELIPTATNGGLNFYLGTLAPGWTDAPVVKRMRPTSAVKPGAHDKRYWRLGLKNVRRDPLRWLALGARRIHFQYGQELNLFWYGGIESRAVRRLGHFYWLVMVTLALVGLGAVVLQRARLPVAWAVIAGSITAVSLLKLAFIVSQRDRLPLTYLLIVLAGLGAESLANLARQRPRDPCCKSQIVS